jgi:hypothetical protein
MYQSCYEGSNLTAMDTQQALNAVIRGALASRGIKTYRATSDAVGIGKDALGRRYRGETPWTLPDLEAVATFLELPASELKAQAERRAA